MNAVVLVASSWHIGYLGGYGNQWISTPHIDRLAAQATVFDRCYSACPSTLPTRRSWWTGRYPFRGPANGVRSKPSLLAEHLSSAGVQTVLVSDVYPLLDAGLELLEGFEDVIGIRGQAYDPRGSSAGTASTSAVENFPYLRLPVQGDDRRGLWLARWEQYLRNRATAHREEDTWVARVVQAGIDWLQQHGRSRDFLLWLDCYDPHEPWDPPEPYLGMYWEEDAEASDEEAEDSTQSAPQRRRPQILFDIVPGKIGEVITHEELRRLRCTYAAEVTLVDTWLGRMLECLSNHGHLDDTLIVLLSDHGVPLGEHGWVGRHESLLYEEVSHVPLIVRWPGGREVGHRCSALVQCVDLAPTLLQFFGWEEASEGWDGRSLVPLVQGEADRVRERAFTGLPGRAWSMRTGGWHFIAPADQVEQGEVSAEETRPEAERGHPDMDEGKLGLHGDIELFAKPEDRWDVNNVAGLYQDVADELLETLRRFRRSL